MYRKIGIVPTLLAIFIGFLSFTYFYLKNKPQTQRPLLSLVKLPTITPTPYQFPYKSPGIPKNRSYRIIIIGDSMVQALGLNANALRLKLIEYYPESEFVTYNYGYGATNILSLPERLTQNTKYNGSENTPVLKQGFELIILESFGYNPLSELPLLEGLEKQNQVLEESVRLILAEKPNAALAFMTPIAPDPINFAKGAYDLSKDIRKAWVDERVSYINNHKKFAEERGIPVIDVYEASLHPNGTVNRSYISSDFIHPSRKGIDLISKTIADYIFNNKVFPE